MLSKIKIKINKKDRQKVQKQAILILPEVGLVITLGEGTVLGGSTGSQPSVFCSVFCSLHFVKPNTLSLYTLCNLKYNLQLKCK